MMFVSHKAIEKGVHGLRYEMLKTVKAGEFGFGNVLAIVVYFKWDGDKLINCSVVSLSAFIAYSVGLSVRICLYFNLFAHYNLLYDVSLSFTAHSSC
jgi:hypothetical protein